jgi:hypothetical protein
LLVVYENGGMMEGDRLLWEHLLNRTAAMNWWQIGLDSRPAGLMRGLQALNPASLRQAVAAFSS